jgi:hypothetical protein
MSIGLGWGNGYSNKLNRLADDSLSADVWKLRQIRPSQKFVQLVETGSRSVMITALGNPLKLWLLGVSSIKI